MAVRLRGLQAAPQLNGQLGVCQGDFDESRGRWQVLLVNGEEKAVKPDNLLPVLESGVDISLNAGRTLHITMGRVAVLDAMEEEARMQLDSDLMTFNDAHADLRADLESFDGWPQCSAVLRGEPDAVTAARAELVQLLQYHGFLEGVDAQAGAAQEEEPPEQVEVEGMTISSHGKRTRERKGVFTGKLR